MRIAVISDIHGNLEALNRVLEDIKKRNIDKIICLGDLIAKGTHPIECVKLIKENCDIVLQGNTDHYFSKDHSIEYLNSVNEVERNRIIWTQKHITKEIKKYLLSLNFCYEFYLSGSLIRLFHSTPNSVYGMTNMFATLDEWYNMFLPSDKTISQNIADVVIYGHLHTPFSNCRYNKTLINTGSVGNNLDFVRNDLKDGNPKETTRACYVILEGEWGLKEYTDSFSYMFVKVHYDIKKEFDKNSDNPDNKEYEIELNLGKYRDMSKVYSNWKNYIDINRI